MNSDSEQLQRLILESRNKFRTLVDGIEDDIYSIDNDNIITSVNKPMANSLKRHPKELVGLKCYEAIYGYERPCEEGAFCPALAARRSGQFETVLQEVREGDRPVRYLEARAMPLFDEQ
ncbi:MAG: PAS domain-containing protein, partial [Deltaproteobacteria bacterium]|nr:PAS domain-containing protein [Deltaproteobacteria bacterium]MBW2140802.1 PAS domain-containing protein [Deltaproteobacteria bacterium]MBW2323929.1 PAS domain-containing protein [Deltaproteobacteria bacterium]